MSRNSLVFVAVVLLFALAFFLPRRESSFENPVPLVSSVADFAARATLGAEGAFARGDYRTALRKIEEETADAAFQKEYGTLPGKLEDPVLAKAVADAGAALAAAADDSAKVAALNRQASAEFDLAERLSYSNEDGAGVLSIRSYLRSIVLSEDSVKLKPTAAAHRQMGISLMELGAEPSVAILSFDAASALDPKDPIPFFRKGLALSSEGKTEEAVKSYLAAIEADSRFERAYVNLGYEYLGMDRKWSAYEAYAKAIEVCGEYCHVAYHNRATTHLAAKDYDAAIKDEESAIAAAETKGYSYRNAYAWLGTAHLLRRDYANAVTYLRLSLNDPYYAPTHDNDWNYNGNEEADLLSLARAYFLLKDFANAKTYAQMTDDADSTEDTRELLRFIDEEEKKPDGPVSR